MVDHGQDSGNSRNKGADRTIRMTIGRRRFPTGLAERWITAWGLSIVLFFILFFIMRGYVVGITARIARTALDLPATPLGGVEAILLVSLLVLLLVAEMVSVAAPLAIPALAAFHIARRWARERVS